MCSQAVCLMAAALERHGISTVAIVLLREVARKVRPPRALFAPFRHGYPLDTPSDPARQHAVLEAALRLLEDPTLQPPVLVDFEIR
jgi:D-proline reductase (dithiol) PrdB